MNASVSTTDAPVAPQSPHAQATAPLGKPRRLLQWSALALDVALLLLAVIAARISGSLSDATLAPLGWVVVFAALVIVNLAAAGVYRQTFLLRFLDDARAIVGATAIAAMIVSFVRLLTGNDPQVAEQASRLWLFTSAYMVAGRAAVGMVRARARRLGAGGQPTLIIGAGYVGQSIARRLLERSEFGLRPVAFLDDEPLPVDDAVDLPVLRGGDELVERLAEAITAYRIEHVVLAFSLASHDRELAVVRRCTELGASVSLVPRLFEGVPDQTRLERIGGIPLITVYPTDPRAWQFQVKYALDRVLALLAVIVLSPLFAIAAVGTLITLGRPVLFRQPRVGMDGHVFDMLKFRTMHAAGPEIDRALAEDLEKGLAPGGVEGDDRRTPFGALLRRTSLDELPQLLNVARGDMSLVGPRPERPQFAERFRFNVHRYGDRLRVKSGITGWAQVHGLRGRTSLADRVEWDNYYIENWSVWLDLKIIFLTLVAVFRDEAE